MRRLERLASTSVAAPAGSGSLPPWQFDHRLEGRGLQMKFTVAKVLFAVAAVLFILVLLSVNLGSIDLITAGLACVAAGLFFEGQM